MFLSVCLSVSASVLVRKIANIHFLGQKLETAIQSTGSVIRLSSNVLYRLIVPAAEAEVKK